MTDNRAINLIPVLGFAAFSGTGKTTLLCALIPQLRARGLRLGLVKHSHHAFEADRPGKDSYVLRQAGASQVVLASAQRTVVIAQHNEVETIPNLDRFLDRLSTTTEPCNTLDLILVEGYKRAAIPKIELHRPSLGHPLLALTDPAVIAVATDAPLAQTLVLPQSPPLFDLNQPEAIAEFILQYVLSSPATANQAGQHPATNALCERT